MRLSPKQQVQTRNIRAYNGFHRSLIYHFALDFARYFGLHVRAMSDQALDNRLFAGGSSNT